MEAIYSNILEINPQEIFFLMKKDIYKSYSKKKILNISKDYIKIRIEIINFIHKISKKMGFKSQTFFLSIYYLDIIILENKDININNFYLLGLSCFIVASKYCENDPMVPPLKNFLNIYNKYNSNIDEKIQIEELFETEVKILKYLNYELHYVTIYDFNLFFFNHGIIKKQQIKDIINNNVNNNNNKNNKSDLSSNEDDNDFIFDEIYIKKILEKIYKKSRYYLDLILLKYKICFKYNSLLLSIYIMKKSIEEVILNEYKLKNKDYYLNKKQIIKKTNIYFKEIMNNFYNIDYELNEKYQELIKDKTIINIFPHQDKIIEVKNKINNIQTNYINLEKDTPNNKINHNDYNYIRKNNITTNGISNFTTSTIENNQLPNYLLSSLFLKNKKFAKQYNSNDKYDKYKNENKKTNETMFDYYNNNKIFYSNILENNKKYSDENKNSNIIVNNIVITNNNINSNIFIKKKSNTLLSQLKNSLKKNFSLNKKRVKDKYSHITNLKSLSKLTSYSNIINNIKEASFSENNILIDEHPSHSLGKEYKENKENKDNMLTDINSESENSKNNIFLIKSLKEKNTNNYFSKDKKNKNLSLISKKLYDSNNNEINKNETCRNNYENNRINDESFKKENINNSIYTYRNTINGNVNENKKKQNNNNKLYFKKVIHNFEHNNKIIKKQNNIKINICKSNINTINNNINKISTNRKTNFLSLSLSNNNYNNEDKKEFIKNRIIYINKNNLESMLFENSKKDKNDNYLYIKKDMIKNEKYGRYNNLSKSKNYYNSNIYENKSYSKNNEKYKMSQSPISLLKEKKTININDDNKIKNNDNKNNLGIIKNTFSTIDNNSSYHKKYIFNSLKKKKNRKKIN